MDGLKHFLWLAAAGLSGAYIGMMMKPIQLTARHKMAYLVSGLLVAFWLTPVLCKYFNLVTPEEISGVAFISGAFWSSIMDKVKQKIDNFSGPAPEEKNNG